MDYKLTKQADGTIELLIDIPWTDIKTAYSNSFDKLAKEIEIKGFRKGKAPKKITEKAIDPAKVYENVIQSIIPKLYEEIISKESLRPVVRPAITLEKAKENTDWMIKIATCEMPHLTLGDYQNSIKNQKKSKSSLWVPGQKSNEKKEDPKITMDNIFTAILSICDITIPNVMIENEIQRLLADLVDRTKQLGLSVEQYLASSGKTLESIRQEFSQEAKDTITLELALEQIAEKEQIIVSDEDIAKVISATKAKEDQAKLENDKYYLARLIRRRKTLDYLVNLVDNLSILKNT